MKNQVKPWQFALALVALIAVGVVLWRTSNQPQTINITDVPRGSNADNALTINMDGH